MLGAMNASRADEFRTFDAGGQNTKSLGLIGLFGTLQAIDY
jgi:hypothetical protein